MLHEFGARSQIKKVEHRFHPNGVSIDSLALCPSSESKVREVLFELLLWAHPHPHHISDKFVQIFSEYFPLFFRLEIQKVMR